MLNIGSVSPFALQTPAGGYHDARSPLEEAQRIGRIGGGAGRAMGRSNESDSLKAVKEPERCVHRERRVRGSEAWRSWGLILVEPVVPWIQLCRRRATRLPRRPGSSSWRITSCFLARGSRDRGLAAGGRRLPADPGPHISPYPRDAGLALALLVAALNLTRWPRIIHWRTTRRLLRISPTNWRGFPQSSARRWSCRRGWHACVL